MKNLILALLLSVSICFALKPGDVTPITITQTRNYQRYEYKLESLDSLAVYFQIAVQYETNDAPEVPIYLHVVTPNGWHSNYKYKLTLYDLATGEKVIDGVYSTSGLRAVHRAKAWIDPAHIWMLKIEAPPSKQERRRVTLGIVKYWVPTMKLFVGAFGNGTLIDAEYR